MSPAYKRWYDHDPKLLEVIELLKNYQDELKEHAVVFLDKLEQKVSKEALEIGQKIKDGGCYFMYHNHAKEFFEIDGDYAFKYMPENIPADLMGFTLDTYWVKAGGHDPVEWLRNLKGRTPCIHLKDIAISPEKCEHRMMPVGQGNINFEKVISAAEKCGTEYLLVEQDNCNGLDPFDCLKMSCDYLRSLGLD